MIKRLKENPCAVVYKALAYSDWFLKY